MPKEQVFYLQHPAALSPYQPILLKQGDPNTDWLAIIQNFFANLGGTPSESETPAETPETEKKPSNDAEHKPQPLHLLPASTTALNVADKRYYFISGQPQFYTTYDALRSPISPLVSFQPLQSIVKGRSADEPSEEPLPAASEESPSIVPKSEPLNEELPQPAAFVPLETLTAIQQQRSNDEDGELKPFDVEPIVREQIAALNEARSQQIAGPAANALIENTVVMAKEIDEDDTSVAQAKPSAIAISGRGGTSSADPVATAITGDGGISLAAPRATAVAGEFEDDESNDYDKNKN